MRCRLIAGLVIALACAPPSAAAASGYSNPVFGREFPDPTVVRVGGVYYAYGTVVRWGGRRHLLPILRSTDLVHWRHVGDAFRRPPRWSGGHWWAPAVLRQGRRYYLFYSAARRDDARLCVAVAVGRSPTGPFRTRRLLLCGRGAGGTIDPAPFRDDDGRAYLYFARTYARCGVLRGFCYIAGVRLSRDLLHTRGRARPLVFVSRPWEIASPTYAAVENPWLLRWRRGYTLLYSGGNWTGRYGMGYATGAAPLGPFVKAPEPFLTEDAGIASPGGGSVVRGPGGGLWLAYHGRRVGPGAVAPRDRTLMIDRLRLPQGRPVLDGPTVHSSRAP